MHRARRAKVVARIVAAFVLLLASGLLLAGGPLASAGVPVRVSASEPIGKISPEVLRATTGGQVAPIAVLLADQADLSTAYSITDRDVRGRYVYDTLRTHANRTQAGLRAELDTLGVSYNSFWVANVIFAEGDRALVERLAARSDVKLIESNASRRVIADPISPGKAGGARSPQAVEWNVARVHAPEVWDLGYRGEGIVIGIHDTGVQWDHPALKPQYRGWNGSTADHNYNWHDAIHVEGLPCPGNSPAPCDGYNHGTHVAGIAVGDDGSSNQTGVAPDAKWIACRSMNNAQNGGAGTPESYTECFQFFLAPYDLAGQNANPDLRPHVVNNSWGCTTGEGCTSGNLQVLKPVVENAQAAGIFVASSSGNSGPSCGSVREPPAIYEATFATGATTGSDELASFSSRGPVTVDGSNRLKPNIVAPGAGIRSAIVGSAYGSMSGTSMASPHVAGAVALLWDARGELQRDITNTKTLLQNTADHDVAVPGGQVCGGTPPTTIPNNLFGYGLVDAYAAVLGEAPSATPTATASATATGAIPTATATGAIPTATATGAVPAATSTSAAPTPTSTGCSIQFADVPSTGEGSTFYSFIRCLACRSIVGGYPCSGPGEPCNSRNEPYFRPGANVTRGQITKMVALAAGLDGPSGQQVFEDVQPGSPFYAPVQQLATAGYISGYPCGTVPGEPCQAGNRPYFRPGASATRAQLSKIVSETAQFSEDPGAQKFTDVPGSSPFFVWVNRLANRGVISGYPCGGDAEPCETGHLPYFRPGANVTRGQTAKIVANTFYPDCQTP